MGSRASGGGLPWLLPLCAVALAGCPSGRSPERTCQSFLAAVAEGDATMVFDRLSQPTQWAMYTVQGHHAAMRALVRQSYPASEQAQALSRLYAAEAENGRDLFSRLYPERYAAPFHARLGSGAAQVDLQAGGAEFLCRRANATGPAFRFTRDKNGLYGLAELADEWESAQLRATHDRATVEKNAEIYRQASGAAAPPNGAPPR